MLYADAVAVAGASSDVKTCALRLGGIATRGGGAVRRASGEE
jgi:hypothetical protein